MGKLFKIPFGFKLFKMANGDEYTVDEYVDVPLTPELEESLEEIEIKADKYFEKKGNGGKGKGSMKSELKVEESQLSKRESVVSEKTSEKEIEKG